MARRCAPVLPPLPIRGRQLLRKTPRPSPCSTANRSPLARRPSLSAHSAPPRQTRCCTARPRLPSITSNKHALSHPARRPSSFPPSAHRAPHRCSPALVPLLPLVPDPPPAGAHPTACSPIPLFMSHLAAGLITTSPAVTLHAPRPPQQPRKKNRSTSAQEA